MRSLGIIPARGGSRRLPGKNLAPIQTRPMIAYTCDAALRSGVLDAVYVNTDSPAIADVARSCGVSCPALRPAALAQDDTSTLAANAFLLRVLAERGEHYDTIVVLQPTSPLRSAEDVCSAMRVYDTNAPCAVVSVSPVAPTCWTGAVRDDGRFERLHGGNALYRLNGAIYIYNLDEYLTQRPPRKTIAYVMPATRGVDVDTQDDLDYAAFLVGRGGGAR